MYNRQMINQNYKFQPKFLQSMALVRSNVIAWFHRVFSCFLTMKAIYFCFPVIAKSGDMYKSGRQCVKARWGNQYWIKSFETEECKE